MKTPIYDYFIKVSIKDKEEAFHWHDIIEVICVLSGQVDVLLNDNRYSLKKDDVLVVNCEAVHRTENTGEGFLYARLHINIDAFHEYLPNAQKHDFQCDPAVFIKDQNPDAALIRENLAKTIHQFLIKENGYENHILQYIIAILKKLQNPLTGATQDGIKYKNKVQSEYIGKIFDVLYQEYTKKITLGDLARYTNISETYLPFIIKDGTGMSFGELLSYVRAEHAMRLMTTSDLSMNAIATECGFASTEQLNAAFQKFYHCLPKEYQKNNKLSFESQVQKDAYLAIVNDYLSEKDKTAGSSDDKIDDSAVEERKVSLLAERAKTGDFILKSIRKGTIRVKKAQDLTNQDVQRMLEAVQKEMEFEYIELGDLFGEDYVKSSEGERVVMWVVIYQLIDIIIKLHCLPRIKMNTSDPENENDIMILKRYIRKKYGATIARKSVFISANDAETQVQTKVMHELTLVF